MSLIYINEEELRNIKSKINRAQMNLAGVKASLSADKVDTKRISEETATYKALFTQLGTIAKQLGSIDDKQNSLMRYIDNVISTYSNTDRKLADM